MKKYLFPLLIAAVLLAAGCGTSEQRVQIGDTVRVDYTGTLEDGTEFDSSFGGEPLEFTVGNGSVISGFDQAVIGMAVGESKRVVIPPEDAYGPHHDEYVFEIDRANFQPGLDPQVGQQLLLRQPDGTQFPVTVTAVSATSVTVDANHPLAGKTLIFDILLVEIVTPTPTPAATPTSTTTPVP